MILLTIECTLLCAYLLNSGIRQKEHGYEKLPFVKSMTNWLSYTENYASEHKCNSVFTQWFQNIYCGIWNKDDNSWSNSVYNNYIDCDVNKKGYRDCPWYLNFTHELAPVEAAVYPFEGYFKEVLANNPQNSLMKYEWARLQSFEKFPRESPAFPIRMAQAGFYYTGRGDSVTCFSCNAKYGNWKDEDLPIDVHKRLSPGCKYLTGKDESNIPIHENDCPTPGGHEEGGATGGSIQADGGSVESRASIEVNQHCAIQNNNSSRNAAKAKHPDYADFTRREASYKGWPCSHIVSPKILTEAGFVYVGVGDCVRCYFCGIGLRNWDEGDCPWDEHARWSQNCQYLQDKKGLEFVRRLQEQTDNAPVEQPITTPLASKEKKESTVNDQVKNKTKELQENITTSKNTDRQLDHNSTTQNEKLQKTSNTPEFDKSTGKKEIKEENYKLKSQLTCKVCMDKPTDTVFLPCGHLVTCHSCSQNLRKCAICRTRVKARIRAFMS